MIVSCWGPKSILYLLIKSQSFRSPLSQGCDLHICFSSGMASPPHTLHTCPQYNIPSVFHWSSDSCWLLFSLRGDRKTRGRWSGRNSLFPAEIRLWQCPFPWRVAFGVELSSEHISQWLPFPSFYQGHKRIFLRSSLWESVGFPRGKAPQIVGKPPPSSLSRIQLPRISYFESSPQSASSNLRN